MSPSATFSSHAGALSFRVTGEWFVAAEVLNSRTAGSHAMRLRALAGHSSRVGRSCCSTAA
jgi:hypothetical protein